MPSAGCNQQRCPADFSAIVRQLLCLLILLCGCTPVRYAAIDTPNQADAVSGGAELATRIAQLTDALLALGPNIDHEQAAMLADTAVHYSLQQVANYRLTRPPLAHNMLVNAGLKPRGLCIHWTEDLLTRLHQLGTSSFELWWGVAERPTPFHVEHSTVVVTARGTPFSSGLVLDGWRNSGWLYWAPVAADKYTWNVMGNHISGTGLD